ncbi:MAG: M28 family peptidase, partial [Chitinophagales bacterium]|nr:M28 family peptidase [Chitinophagales bacterium]
YNFAKNNVPVIFYFNGTHADYHKPSDDIEKINFDLLAERTKLVFYTLWILANQDVRIKVDVLQE